MDVDDYQIFKELVDKVFSSPKFKNVNEFIAPIFIQTPVNVTIEVVRDYILKQFDFS